MNRIKQLMAMLFSLASLHAFAQELTLDSCIREAMGNYPAIRQYELIEKSRDYTLSNAAKGWLPQVSISLGGYGFTDPLASGSPLDKMGVSLKNGLANGTLSVSQTIYDGGRIAAQREIADIQAETSRRQTDVTLYAVKERVEQLYFSLLLLDEQRRQNEVLLTDLHVSLKTVESLVHNGLANEADRESVLVEILKAEQQDEQLESSRNAYLRMLGIFTGKEIGADTPLAKPEEQALSLPTEIRPELAWYASRQQLIDKQRRQLDVRLRPTLSAFGMGMLHSKVTDLVNDGMLFGGISLSWNIGALYTRRNDLRLLETQRKLVENEQDIFLFQNRLQEETDRGAITALRKQLGKDETIVRLRESIREKSQKRVELGTESVNEMLRQIHAVSQARLQKNLHEIRLLQELYHLKHIQTTH